MHKKIVSVLFVIVLAYGTLVAQVNTVSNNKLVLTYEQAKAILLKENLQVLANHYELEAAEAELVQAKVWNNPYFVWNQDLYSVEKNHYFHYRNQRLIQVEQIFSVAGKHTNTVKLAKVNIAINQSAVEDILRSLVLELSDVYTDLHTLQQKKVLYTSLIENYEKIVQSANVQVKLGALAANDELRLKSEAISIKAEAVKNANDVEAAMSQLRKLLNLTEETDVETVEKNNTITTMPGLEELKASVKELRPDYKIAELEVEYEKRNLKLQKSLSVPDLKLAYQPHDRGSNYVRPYTGMNFEAPIPLFDRNQGNIKMAKAKIQQSQLKLQQKENEIMNELATAYKQYTNTQNVFGNYDEEFVTKMEEMSKNANSNFTKKNIGLLEYLDQQRNYLNTKMQILDLKNEKLKAINQLNYSCGKEIL